MNTASSRSHSIYTLTLTAQEIGSEMRIKLVQYMYSTCSTCDVHVMYMWCTCTCTMLPTVLICHGNGGLNINILCQVKDIIIIMGVYHNSPMRD